MNRTEIMPHNPEISTPLQNLFLYIKELYSDSKPIYDFKEQKNKYWKLETLKQIFDLTQRRKDVNFKLNLNEQDNFLNLILSIKRIQIPKEPKIPFILKDWISISSKSAFQLNKKEFIEIKENFSDSSQRLNDFDNFIQSNISTIPKSLEGWISLNDNNIKRKRQLIKKVYFKENIERVSVFSTFEKEFKAFYEKYKLPLHLNKIYDALHKLNYELKSNDTLNLYLSFGLISGKIGGKNYQNHLFHVPLRMNLSKQTIKIEFDYLSNNIFAEQHFSNLLDKHFINDSLSVINQRKIDVSNAINKFNINTNIFSFVPEVLRKDYYDLGLKITSVFSDVKNSFFDGESLDFNFYEVEEDIRFSFSPVIQTKAGNSFQSIANDANMIANKISDLVTNKQQHLIPDFFKNLFKTTSAKPTNGSYLSRNGAGRERNYLFPLPFNDEQLEIARKIDMQDTVVVKGPPGTGKSHTIANLIAHYVASGKSILVVSQKAKALSVLQDKLPKDIQSLTVSLTDEAKGSKKLRSSVEGIINNLSKSYSKERLKELEDTLQRTNNRKTKILEQIYTAIKENHKIFKINNPQENNSQAKRGNEWAEYLYNQMNDTNIEIIKDEISYNQEITHLIDELMLFIDLGCNIPSSDFSLMNYNFINDDLFIKPQELRKVKASIQQLSQKIDLTKYQNFQATHFNQELISEIEIFEEKYAIFQKSSFYKEVFQSKKLNLTQLKKLLHQHEKSIQQVDKAKDILINYEVNLEVLESTDPDILLKQINLLISKFGDSKTLSWLQKATLDKNTKRFFHCQVNSVNVDDIEQLKVVEQEILKRVSLKQLLITFNNFLKIHNYEKRNDIDVLLKDFRFILSFNDNLNQINKSLQKRHFPIIDIKSSNIVEYLIFLKDGLIFHELHELNDKLIFWKNKLFTHKKAHPLIEKIAKALTSLDNPDYEYLVVDYQRYREKKEKVLEYEKYFKSLSRQIPKTIKTLDTDLKNGKKQTISREILSREMFLSKIKNLLKSITDKTQNIDLLLHELQLTKYNIEKQIEDLIAYKAWFYKSRNTKSEQKTALIAWLNDLTNIGKGSGRNTSRNQKSAIENMKKAKSAVPVWIMQKDKAITLFPDSTPQQFDLLIIDEASQCDISGLNLIFKCKKSLIVGDSNQTAVGRSPATIDKTNRLLDELFSTHPFKTQFDPNNKNNSIYTLSSVIYPNIITLKEHFRCLPEIIGFSNKHIYNNEMIPLKTALELPFGSPLESHYIEDNFADKAKVHIVNKVIFEIEKYIEQYRDKQLKSLPTIGIVTLDSSNKQHLKELLKQISTNELIRKYEDHINLLIGTAREFQGDERDIMFLTISTSHKIDENTQIMKPPRAVTSEEYMRIYNVAASRAKEKSVLIHSIHPDAISLIREDCYRKKLIDYYNTFQNTASIQSKNLDFLLRQVDVNSGEFERSVCTFLFKNGFGNYLFPQFSVGNYSIDFAIIKNNQKIAIECDGQQFHSSLKQIQTDIKRQLILERAGWKFLRIQSIDWFSNREAEKQEILTSLHKYFHI